MRMLARRMTAIVFGLSLAGLAEAPGAQAAVLYQSIPTFNVLPRASFCSQCVGDGQDIGQFFTLGSGATAESLTFTVMNTYVWPTPVTVDIFRDGGSGTLGSNIYQQTFSTFASDIDTGFGTDVVTVSLGTVALSAGAYDIFLFNPGSLAIPGYDVGSSRDEIYVSAAGGAAPSTGDSYSFVGYADAAIQLSGTPLVSAPEPMTLGLFGAGFAGLSATRRRRKLARIA